MSLLVAALFGFAFWLFGRAFLADAGQRALARLPDSIELRRVPGDSWGDPATAERLAKPLREKGFVELGVYKVAPSAGFKLGVLVNEKDGVAAFLTERPDSLGISLELNVRYVDGTTTMLINRADNGVPKPPFFHVTYDSSGASSGELYERLLRERSSVGIKKIATANVLAEYQAAWTRMMGWQKGRGLSPEEVSMIAAVARSGAADPASDDWSTDFPGQSRARDAFTVECDGAAFRISWKLGTPLAAAFLFIVAIGWYKLNRFMMNLGGPTPEAGAGWFAFLWALLPAAGYAYIGLALLLDTRVARIDPERLTVRSAPIPWLSSRDVPTADIGRVYSEPYLSHEGRGGGGAFYRVALVRKSGGALVIAGGFSNAAKAEFLAQQLNDYLGGRGPSPFKRGDR